MYLSNTIAGCLLFVLLSYIVVGYIFIRCMIWSIVWCEKGGKYNRLIKLKKNVSIPRRITMNYLISQTTIYRKEYLFWMKVKSVFVIAEAVVTILYIIGMFLWQLSVVIEIIMILITAQAFLLAFLMRFQFDFHRHSKYDRIRINRK